MDNEKIPAVIPLIQQGIAIFKEEYETLIKINALYLGFTFLGLAAFIGSLVLVGGVTLSLGLIGLGLMSIVGVVVLVLFWWILIRLVLAMLYTIRDYDQHLSLRQAFAHGRNKVIPFVWVMILTMLAVVGSLVCVFVIGSIILFPFFYAAPQLVGALGVIILLAGLIVTALVTGSWFAFTSWLFVDQNARGLHALALSKHLSHKHLGPIMWRLFCLALIYIFVDVVLELIFGFVFSFIPGDTGTIIAGLVTDIVLLLSIIPVFYASFFSLYTGVEASQVIDTDSKSHGEHRGMLGTLAFIGFLAVCAVPMLIGFSGAGNESREGYSRMGMHSTMMHNGMTQNEMMMHNSAMMNQGTMHHATTTPATTSTHAHTTVSKTAPKSL
jgi:hypothetical protein